MINLESERLVRLSNIQTILNNWGITSMIIDGALLGLVRNGKLIPWDWDAEMAIISSQFKLENFEYAMTDLVRQNYQIKSVSGLKFFKTNLYHSSDPHFIYSIFLLREANKYYVRPRFRYPKDILDGGHDVISINECSVRIPKRAIELLEFVYGKSWQVPLKSRKATGYLSRSVFRWGYFDFCYRLINKVLRIKILVPRFFVSKYLNKREFIFRSILKLQSYPSCNLIEIGSSDGKETLDFLKNHFENTSIIFEPRFKAHEIIMKSLDKNDVRDRYRLRDEVVVQNLEDSARFTENEISNLSSISQILSKKPLNKFSYKEFRVSDLIESQIDTETIIKMDVEGYEMSLLKGINASLSPNQKIAILMELHQDKYDFELAKGILNELLSKGFKIEFIETSSHPKPRILRPFLLESPLLISGRRALWRVKDTQDTEIFKLILNKTFVYNEFTSEFGYRVARSIFLTRGIIFANPPRSIQTHLWRQVYKI